MTLLISEGGEGGDSPLFLVLSNANITHYCERWHDTTELSEATDELMCPPRLQPLNKVDLY